MSVTAVMQSFLASPNQMAPANYLPRGLRRQTTLLRVRSMSSDEQQPPAASDPAPAPAPKAVSTKFSDLLAFSGPAPERINGRLAMTGFAAAMVVEVASGQDVFAQISHGGVTWLVGTSVIVSLASLVPLVKGVRVESFGSGRVMNPDAEMWNGRFAMLGLIALAFTEYVIGGALV